MKSCSLILLLLQASLLAQEPAPNSTPALKVLETTVVKRGERSTIYRRVEPPSLDTAVSATSTPASPAVTATYEERAQKNFVTITLSATVYDRKLTHLQWTSEGHVFHAWSNADFNLFASCGEVETNDTVYCLTMGIGNEAVGSDGKPLDSTTFPPPTRFDGTRAQYFVEPTADGLAPTPAALAGLNALHAYYEATRAQLVQESAQREADRIAAEEVRRTNPPAPRDTVIHFWPKKSRTYPTAK